MDYFRAGVFSKTTAVFSPRVVKEFLQNSRTRPGSFILRPSFTKPNCVSVSVVLGNGNIRHLNIHHDTTNGQYYLVPETKFNSVQELIAYHAVNPVHNEEQVMNVRFLYPISRHSRTHRRATEPSVPTEPYQRLANSQGISNGMVPGHSNSRTSSVGRNRAGSDFGHGESHGLQRGLSTRSEGAVPFDSAGMAGSRARSLSDKYLRRSPHDKLPTVPPAATPDWLSERPPAALPNGDLRGDKKVEYSRPRPGNLDLSKELEATLREIEPQTEGICDCGLPTKESQLPEGWSVHQTGSRLFYQSSEGRTDWNLPPNIAAQLTEEHKENLKKLEKICRGELPVVGTENTSL